MLNTDYAAILLAGSLAHRFRVCFRDFRMQQGGFYAQRWLDKKRELRHDIASLGIIPAIRWQS